MSAWKPLDLSKNVPKRRQLCDFIFPGTEGEPLVWMLCNATIMELIHHDASGVLWRPAEPLPDGICEFD